MHFRISGNLLIFPLIAGEGWLIGLLVAGCWV
jgi:hypothetical protein